MQNSMDELAAKRHQFWHAWRRRGFVLAAFLLVLVPLYGTFRPLFEFLIFAASLAALTYPVLFKPIENVAKRLVPDFLPERRSEICAVIATGLLLVLLLLPFVVIVYGGSSSDEDLGGALVALLMGDSAGRDALLRGVAETIREVQAIYPRIPIDEERAVAFASEFLGDAREFSGSILDYIFKGTRGFVAELALALIALSFLYAHGPSFIRKSMVAGGFEATETTAWMRIHRRITLRLLSAIPFSRHWVAGFVLVWSVGWLVAFSFCPFSCSVLLRVWFLSREAPWSGCLWLPSHGAGETIRKRSFWPY